MRCCKGSSDSESEIVFREKKIKVAAMPSKNCWLFLLCILAGISPEAMAEDDQGIRTGNTHIFFCSNLANCSPTHKKVFEIFSVQSFVFLAPVSKTLAVITGSSDHNSLRGHVQLLRVHSGPSGSRTPECMRTGRRQHPVSGLAKEKLNFYFYF